LWIVITDWEAIVDREPDELLPTVSSSDSAPGKSNLKLENAKSGTPKRRGRGTFSYEKKELYSDQLLDSSVVDVEQAETRSNSEDNRDVQSSKWYGMVFQSLRKKPVIWVFCAATTILHMQWFVVCLLVLIATPDHDFYFSGVCMLFQDVIYPSAGFSLYKILY